MQREAVIALTEEALRRHGQVILDFLSNRDRALAAQRALDHFLIHLIQKVGDQEGLYDIIYWALRQRMRMLEGLISHDLTEIPEDVAFWESNRLQKRLLSGSLPRLPRDRSDIHRLDTVKRSKIFAKIPKHFFRFLEPQFGSEHILLFTELREDTSTYYEVGIYHRGDLEIELWIQAYKPSAVIRLPKVLKGWLEAPCAGFLSLQLSGGLQRMRKHHLKLDTESVPFGHRCAYTYGINRLHAGWFPGWIRGALIVTSPEDHFGFQSLPYSAEEGSAIAQLLEKESVKHIDHFTAASATVSALRSSISQGVDLIHLACHGVAGGGLPASAACLVLAGEAGGEPEGSLLSYYEILHLPLRSTQLVVLSCCRSAFAADDDGLAIQSLAFAFLKAGAAMVLASLNNVDDELTARLMPSFYEALFEYGDGAEALRRLRVQYATQPAMKREVDKWIIYT